MPRRRMLVLTILLCIQLLFPGLAVADPGQEEVRLQAPSSVVRGEGFVCRFMPVLGGSSYTLEWLDKN
ncbi:MAG: hypothetical protein WCR47_06275, partial [Desulfoplanes sp.]